MKLFSRIFIICALVTEAWALKCISCIETSGECQQTEQICKQGPDEKCTTQLIALTENGKTKIEKIKACGMCIVSHSFNYSYVAQYADFDCCDKDLCNDKPFPELPAENGLQCVGYYSDSSKPDESIVKCIGIEDRCMIGNIVTENPKATIVFKGCTSKNLCHQHASVCCEGNLCNKGTTVPGSWIAVSFLAVIVATPLM